MVVDGTKWENRLQDILDRYTYVVVRTAGSTGWCDLTVIRPFQTYNNSLNTRAVPIEVKSTKADVFYPSHNSLQNKMACKLYDAGYDYYYCIRWKERKEHYGLQEYKKYELFRPDVTAMEPTEGKKLNEVFYKVGKDTWDMGEEGFHDSMINSLESSDS